MKNLPDTNSFLLVAGIVDQSFHFRVKFCIISVSLTFYFTMWGGVTDWLGTTTSEQTNNDDEDEDDAELDITTSFWSAINLIKEKVKFPTTY